MKKILGISLIAVLAVSPMMASAEEVGTGTTPAHTDSPVLTGVAEPGYALAQSGDNDDMVVSAGYVKGAYNAAIKAVNKVNAKVDGKQNTISDLATIRSGAAAGATALQESSISTGATNGNITVGSKQVAVKGLGSAAYTASTAYDAAGAATTAAGAVESKLTTTTPATNGYDINAKSLKVQGAPVLTSHQDISGKADKATTLAGYGITDAYTKTETGTQITNAVNALDSSVSQTAGTANGNLALSVTETNGKITAISGTVQHQDISGKADKATTLAGYGITDGATKQGVVSTVNKATASKTGASLAVSGTPTGTISNTVTQGSISTTVSVPTSANLQTLTTWGSDTTIGSATVSLANTDKAISANVTGAGVTSTFNGTGISNGTATGNITGITVNVDGYYASASATKETFQ